MKTIHDWKIEGAVKDAQTVTAEWSVARLDLIDGVAVREVRHVPKANGYLTEVLRRDWAPGTVVDQVFRVLLAARALSAWHAHEATTDRLFVTSGLVRIVLFDGRGDSPTSGRINEFKFGSVRPALLTIPPRVWHGMQNLSDAPASVLNLVDRAYDYAAPDHWRVPEHSPAIPFQWPDLPR